MSGGYHSRSPEEFRQYLDSIKQSKGKRGMRNLIVFLDIILLLVVFYMASKLMNPGADVNLKNSNKIVRDGKEYYITKSNQSTKDLETIYFIINNISGNKFDFPGIENMEITYKSETNVICLQKIINIEKKSVANGSRDFIPINILKVSKETLPPDCKNLYKTPAFPRTVYTIFDRSKKYRIDLIAKGKDSDGNDLELIIPDENW